MSSKKALNVNLSVFQPMIIFFCFHLLVDKCFCFFRSSINHWFLLLTARSKDLDRRREEFYRPIVEELKILEKGINIGNQLIKVGVVVHLGDNLEAHCVSGLSCCFSSKDVCRHCHIQVTYPSWILNLGFVEDLFIQRGEDSIIGCSKNKRGTVKHSFLYFQQCFGSGLKKGQNVK